MDGTQELVLLGGFGLLGVHLWTSSQRADISAAFFGGKGAPAAHTALLQIAGELLLLLILIVVAGQGGGLAAGMLAVVASLWVLWGISHYRTPATGPAGPGPIARA